MKEIALDQTACDKKVVLILIPYPMTRENLRPTEEEVLKRCLEVRSKSFLPLAPCLMGLRYFTEVTEGREYVRELTLTFISRKSVDEVWLCGQSMSQHEWEEVHVAKERNILVILKGDGIVEDKRFFP